MADRAEASWHVFFDDALGTINAFLHCPGGDIYQNYKDPSDWVNDDNYTPQIDRDHSRLMKLVLSATGSDDIRVASAQWFYNGVDCATQPGYFESSIVNGAEARLTLIGNIAKLTHNQSAIIRCNAKVGTPMSLSTTSVNASKEIPVMQMTKDTYRSTIVAVNEEANFTIGADGSPVLLKCITYDWQGNIVDETALSYQWQKQTTNQGQIVWEPFGDDSDTASVDADAINCQAMIRVEVSMGGHVIAADLQTVYDTHDPIQIVPRFDPEDCTIRKGSGNAEVINVYIDIVRSDGTRVNSANLTFTLLDTVGNQVQDVVGRRWENVHWVNKETGLAANEINRNSIAFTITQDDFANGGRELIFQVEAEGN